MQKSGEPKSTPEFAKRLPNAVEACADRIDPINSKSLIKVKRPSIISLKKRVRAPGKNADSLEELLSAVVELQVLVSLRER